MELDQIIKLIDAGYTKEDIQQMTAAQSAPEEKPSEPLAPEEKPAEPAKDEKPAEPFDTQPFTKALDEMSAAMNQLNVKLQKMALSMYEAPQQKETSVSDIIAKIIDPKG